MSSESVHVDEELIEAAESAEDERDLLNLFGRYKEDGSAGRDGSIDTVRAWMPDEKQMQGKTDIAPHQAQALAIGRHMDKIYRMLGIEIDGLDAFMTGVIEDYEMYLTSIDGTARDEQVRVLMAMFGAHADAEDASRTLLSRMLSGQDGDDE